MIRFYLACLLTGLAFTQALAADAKNGQEIFLRQCAVCHGNGAKGDGPMAPAMVIKPVNLTRLSAGNNGVFPLVRVIKRIDGRDPLISHGSPMPVYGQFFEGLDIPLKTEAGQPILTSAPIADLVEWLKSVQQ